MDSNSTEFLRKKAANFIKFIVSLGPDAYVISMISGFDPSMIAFTFPIAKAMILSKGIDSVVEEIRQHTKSDGSDRVRRYLDMFISI